MKLFSKSAAIEFGMLKYNIRVNSVHPGGIHTPMMHAIIDRYVQLGAVPSREAAEAGVIDGAPVAAPTGTGAGAAPGSASAAPAGGAAAPKAGAAAPKTGAEAPKSGGGKSKS